MCSVIGAFFDHPSKKQLTLLKNVFIESKIRGMHATGISYIQNNEIITIKKPIPSDEFFKDVDFEDHFINEDGNLYMIGHCRYSTSDLEYNQPIYNDDISIVHNGVITQELPENWKSIYDIVCQTKNDSEFILKTLEQKKEPLSAWPDTSMAVCELYSDKKIRFYRNAKRPLTMAVFNNGVIVSSTKDILKRANTVEEDFITLDCDMNVIYTIDSQRFQISNELISTNRKDLQYEL
jgi:glutamine phosphoribosylpyrophosphate amidotransferase